jgi:hypothetical protein
LSAAFYCFNLRPTISGREVLIKLLLAKLGVAINIQLLKNEHIGILTCT